jgi:hypothetical protein
MIPQTFNEWTNCIINNCKINITEEFAQQRLAIYLDNKNTETQKFVALYGDQHLQNVITWLKKSSMVKDTKIRKFDIIGILSASICLVHCIATPFLIVLGASFLTQPFIKYVFLITSFVAVFKTTNKSKNTKISILLLISFWGFLFTTLFDEQYEWLHFLTYLFSFLIILGHLLNIKYCKTCKDEIE